MRNSKKGSLLSEDRAYLTSGEGGGTNGGAKESISSGYRELFFTAGGGLHWVGARKQTAFSLEME